MDNKNIGKKGFTTSLFQTSQNEKQNDWIEKSDSNFHFYNSGEENDQIFSTMQLLIKKALYNHLVDFDDHLGNGSLDWRNENLFKNI